MIGKWKLVTAVPLALAIGACSSRTSNADTAAGSLSVDTSTSLTPAPSTPAPGMDTGMVLDTTRKQADTTHADSLKKDSAYNATGHSSPKHKTRTKSTRKP